MRSIAREGGVAANEVLATMLDTGATLKPDDVTIEISESDSGDEQAVE